MSKYVDKILSIIKAEDKRGKSGLNNMLLALSPKEQERVLIAFLDYQDRFKEASLDYRAIVSYLTIGVLQDIKEGDDIADRIEVEVFGEHIAHSNIRQSLRREVNHDRIYNGPSPYDENEIKEELTEKETKKIIKK